MMTRQQHCKRYKGVSPVLHKPRQSYPSSCTTRLVQHLQLAVTPHCLLNLPLCCGIALCAPADFGAEKAVSVQGLDAAGVTKKLQELVKAGESMPK